MNTELFNSSYAKVGFNSPASQDDYDPEESDPSGILDDEAVANIKKQSEIYLIRRFINLAKKGLSATIIDIALSEEFIKANQAFVASGELIYIFLKTGESRLVPDLLNAGYPCPGRILIRCIESEEVDIVDTMLLDGLYPQSIVQLAFWMLVKKGMNSSVQILHSAEKLPPLFKNYNLSSDESVGYFVSSPEVLNFVIKSALDNKEDRIACGLLINTPVIIDAECTRKALQNACVETLKVIWSGNLVMPGVVVKTRASKSVIWNKLNLDIFDKTEKKKINKMLRIASILQCFLLCNQVEEASQVLDWPEACNEAGILRVLTRNSQEDLMLKHLSLTKVDISSAEFLDAFEKGFYKACVQMLKSKEPRGLLIKENIQAKLISLLESGNTCLLAIEILNYINFRDWSSNLTESLCETLDNLINEAEDLIICPAPILFCILSIEFLTNISLNSAQNKHRCIECSEAFYQQVVHIQNSLKEIEVMKYYMTDSDSRGRSALLIISENNMLKLLENESVGAIISSMWNGEDAQWIWDCSGMYKSIIDKDSFLEPIEITNRFKFSFSVWTESTSFRYFVGGISVVFLLIVYNALIIEGTKHDNFKDLSSNDSTGSLLRLSQILILGLMMDLVMQYMFCSFTKRLFKLDAMRIVDLIIFGMMLLILAGLQHRMGPGKDYPSADPEIFVGLIHSLENLFVWVRFLLILITTKSLGPFLYMIYEILKKMVTFYFLFACFSIWFAAVFTALFSAQPIGDYDSFWISMRTLYSSSLGGFNFDNFQNSDKPVFGALLLGLYLIITNIILLNLFIALFTTIYQKISEQIESTYRATVVSNYEKWRWDRGYGGLILYFSPFSVFGAFLTPILASAGNPERINQLASKIMFSAVYGSFTFLVLLIIEIVLLPFAWIVGIFRYPRKHFSGSVSFELPEELEKSSFKFKKLLIWLFLGIFILFHQIILDLIAFWRIVFTDYFTEKALNPFLTSVNIKALIETLKNLNVTQIDVDSLVEAWSFTRSILAYEETSVFEKKSAQDFFVFLSKSKERVIDVQLALRILLIIGTDDFNRLDNFRLPFINKAINSHRSLIGGIEVNGVLIPKKLGQPGGPIDVANMKKTSKIIEEMSGQLDYFEKVIGELKMKMDLDKFQE